MVREVGGAQGLQAVYGRQQFYADRTVELKIPKTVQIGATDKVTLSPDVQAMRAAQSPVATSQNISVNPAAVFMYNQPVKQLTYDDPRRTHAHATDDEKTSVDHAGPDQKSEDSEFTPGIEAAGDTAGGSAAGTR